MVRINSENLKTKFARTKHHPMWRNCMQHHLTRQPNQHSQSLCNKVSADPWVRRRRRRVGRRIISFPISVWLDRCKFQVLVCLCCRGKASDRVAAIRCDQIGLSNDFHLAVQYSGGTRFLVNERETRWYHRSKRRAFRSSVSKSTCSGSGPG